MTTLDQIKTFLIDYFDDNHDFEISLDSDLINSLEKEWQAFEEFMISINFDPDEHRVLMLHPERSITSYLIEDWVYTRNRDGAGFWDGDWDPIYGMKLTQFCHQQGPIQIYLDEDSNTLYRY